VGDRALVGTRYLDDARLRAEYQSQIAPRTVAALGKILSRLFPRQPEPAAGVNDRAGQEARPKSLRALDLGAGTGAVGDALRAHFGRAMTLVSVDQVPGPNVRLADVTNPGALAEALGPARRFDLVIAAHVLNELVLAEALAPADRIERLATLVRRWTEDLLAPTGILILIEPALRETSRPLLAVRDRLLAAGDLRVVAPCFLAGPCPALLRDRDWCHDAVATITIEPRPGGRNPHRVDFSYLAVRPDRAAPGAPAGGEGIPDALASPPTPPANDPTLFRVVSDLLVEKGRLRVFGCGPAGRHALVRLDRHATPANQAFARVRRGDVIHVAPTTLANDGLRLGPATTVTDDDGQG